jgi:hypothetical protein
MDSQELVEPMTHHASPMIGNNFVLTADPLIKDVGVINNHRLCESLVKIDLANPHMLEHDCST